MRGESPETNLETLRGILEKMLRDEQIPERARPLIARLGAGTTPEDLGMDSLARFALLGELKRAFGGKIDPHAIAGAQCVGDVLRAIEARSR